MARIIGLDRQRRFLWPDPDDGDRYLGAAQADWLDEQLGRSPARWSVLAQQTTFAPVSHDARSGGWPTADRSRALTAASKAETDVVVLTGDIQQIDNPYLDQSSNGLSYLIEKMKGLSVVGHVSLAKSERSELASLAATRL